MRTAVIGASAGLGRALAEELAGRGHSLFLVSSDSRDLEPIAADLKTRFGAKVEFAACDIATADAEGLRRQVLDALGGIDNLLLIAGVAMQDRDGQSLPPSDLARLLDVNFAAPVRIANAFLPDLAANPAGNLVGAGSVAAVRGRRNNMAYGAAKRGFEAYAESLRHYFAKSAGAKVQFYRLGYLKTRMTAGQKLPFPALDPVQAAKAVADNLGRDLGTVYLPGWWALIMGVIGRLPWAVFRRLDI